MSGTQQLTDRRTWLMPIILIIGMAATLPAIYLSATADPQGHLADLPVGLVLEQQADANGFAVASTVADAIEEAEGEAVSFVRMTSRELSAAIEDDRLAGAVVIPEDFDASIASLMPGATSVQVPTVTIVTNAGDGGLNNGLLVGNVTPLLRGVAQGLSMKLIDTVGASALPATNLALLSDPFHIASAPFEPLPAHAGLGTSAFYYSLVLVLIAFIGASLVGPLVDSALGFIPAEVGPLVARRPYAPVSRRRTFVAKSAILVAAAPLAALAAQWVATGVGVSTSEPVMLWLFSTAVIAAIGTSALAVFAVLGSGIGSLVNTLFFVALSMVSSGAIVPLEATPPFFQWLSDFVPFRHVIDGVRALLYFDGNTAAGLGDAWISVCIGAVIGITIGVIVTTIYERVPAFSRHPRAATGDETSMTEHTDLGDRVRVSSL